MTATLRAIYTLHHSSETNPSPRKRVCRYKTVYMESSYYYIYTIFFITFVNFHFLLFG